MTTAISYYGKITPCDSHHPKEYRYLVHAFNPQARIELSRGRGAGSRNINGDQTINLSTQPERLTERVTLSMSLIDQDHTGTWGATGLIVAAPETNILMTSPEDIGTQNHDLDRCIAESSKFPVLSPEELLRLTSSTRYNEVVARASNGTQAIQLAGFFYKVSRNGDPLDQAMTMVMRAHAMRLGLPIIPIYNIGESSKNKITRDDSGLSVYLDNTCYRLIHKAMFQAIDIETYKEGFMSQEELSDVLDYMRKNGIDDKELSGIAEAYHQADNNRKKGRVEFDDKGYPRRIIRYDGYGADTCSSIIGIGYAHKYNLQKQVSAIGSAMCGTKTSQNYYTKIDPWTARKIMLSAVGDLDQTERDKVIGWFEDKVFPTLQEHEPASPVKLILTSLGKNPVQATRADTSQRFIIK